MTRVQFYLPIEPFSINRMYYRDKRHKTAEFRDWENCVLSALNLPHVQKQLQKVRETFDERQHCFMVRLTAHFPAQVLFNKQGLISSRAEDLTNIEKPLIDLMFLPKYFVQDYPNGVKNVNADDKHILQLTSSKRISKDGKYYFKVSIAVVSRSAAGPLQP